MKYLERNNNITDKRVIIVTLLMIAFHITILKAQYGAGVYIEGAGKITNCHLRINANSLLKEVDSRGGGVAISGTGAEVTGCHFERNHAGHAGVAIYLINGSASIINTSIVGNKNYGGVDYPTIFTESGSTLTLTNCVVWGNKQQTGSPNLPNFGGSGTITATYCALEGTNVYPGTGNIALSSANADATGPNFVSFVFNNSQNVHLTNASPLRGAGNAAAVPATLITDLDGNPRTYGNFVDIGAYQTYSPILVTGKTVTYTGLEQGIDAPKFYNATGGEVQNPGGTVTYTYSKEGTPLGAGVLPKDAGTYEVVASFTGGGGLPAGESNKVTFTINPKDITVTALGGSSMYGETPADPGLSANDLENNETVSVLTGLSNSFGIDATTPVGVHPLTVEGTLTNGNYNVTSTNPGEWEVKGTVSFDTQGGSQIPDQTVSVATPLEKPNPNPTRTGHTFGGWYKEAACTNVWTFGTDVVTENKTLYAKWIVYVPPTPPVPVLHKVIIDLGLDASLAGCVTSYPEEGEYEIEAGSILTFLLFLADACELSDITLSANDEEILSEEEKLTPRAIAYTYRIPINGDTEIRATGVERNNPVSIEELSSNQLKVYTIPNHVVVEQHAARTPQHGLARVYSMMGTLVKQQPLSAGSTTIPLQKGVYLLVIEDMVVKVMIHD